MNWNLWNEFCTVTGREKIWGKKISSLLKNKNILPCNSILDIGCGDGQFTNHIAKYAKIKCKGIDTWETNTKKNFLFEKISFENIKDFNYDLFIFKQSFHLLKAPFIFCKKNLFKPIVIIQMLKPTWENKDWKGTTLCYETNAQILTQKLKKDVEIITLEQNYPLSTTFYKKIILEGFSSDLFKKTKKERKLIWKNIKDKNTYKDILKVIIAK